MKLKNNLLSSTKPWGTKKYSWTKNIFFIKADSNVKTEHSLTTISVGDVDYVLKIGSGAESAYQVELESLLFPLVEGVISLPNLAAHGPLSNQKDQYFQIFQKSAGISLDKYTNNLHRLSVIEALGKKLAKLHTLPATGAGMLEISKLKTGQVQGVKSTWNDFLKLQLEEQCQFLNRAQILSNPEVNQIDNLFQTKFPEPKKSLLHGDLANHNVMGHDCEFTALLDWEAAVVGDPLYDLAFYHTGCFNNPQWFDALIKGYFGKKFAPKFDTEYYNYLYLRISLAKAVSRLRLNKSGVNLPNLRSRILYALSKFK